jgi:uncharacterized membrane protein
MNFHDPESMSEVIGNVLRFGVALSAVIISFGTALLVITTGLNDVGGSLAYSPGAIPHGTFNVSLAGLVQGLAVLDPYSIIELGVLVLLATPLSRVSISVFLFAAEGDKTYVYITAGVLSLLLFSMLVTPYIPGFMA